MFNIEGKEKEPLNTYGVVMVKPTAYEQGLDVNVAQIIEGDFENNPWYRENFDQTFTEIAKRVRVSIGPIIRDLSQMETLCAKIMQVFYGKEKEKRFYPILEETYRGPVAFYVVGLKGSDQELQEYFARLKGRPYLKKDDSVETGFGIRGALLKPANFISDQELQGKEGTDYETAIKPLIDNVIHTTDGPKEAAEAINCIINEGSFAGFTSSDFELQSFVNRYV